MTATKDYRVTLKVRNNRLLRAIEAGGGEPGGKWCEANGLNYGAVNDLINMRTGPLTSTGEMSLPALKLCEVLGKLPDELWSNEQLYPLERNCSELEMDYAQILALRPIEDQYYLPDFSGIENEQTKQIIEGVLNTLNKKEYQIIKMRFTDGLTLDEVGKMMGVTRERIRQIELHALRKLRSPARVGMLLDCVNGDVISDADRLRYKAAAAKYLREQSR